MVTGDTTPTGSSRSQHAGSGLHSVHCHRYSRTPRSSPLPPIIDKLSVMPVPHGTTSGDDEDDEDFESSETLVPEALWEEIAQLARGETQRKAPAETPRPTIGRPAKPIPRVGDRTPEPTPPPAPVPVVTVERPVSRRVVADVEPAPARKPVRQPHAFSLDGLSGQDALRRAIVLKEVLGPPVSLRSRGE